jgi:cysteine desulfurase
MKERNKPYIYLDNNGTTPMDKKTIKELAKWCEKAQNPSSSSKYAKCSKKILNKGKKKLLEHCSCNKENYTAIYTSGATESNCFIIRSLVSGYKKKMKKIPTIIISSIEHESIISCCESLKEDKTAKIKYVKPNIYGIIEVNEVEKQIKDSKNVCLVSIMYANNELGTINNIRKIGKIVHKYNIPFHTDAVQIFGKKRINIPKDNIDALSLSFHKFNGMKGLGVLFINNKVIKRYDLHAQINGNQQEHLRGGTENIPAIASSLITLKNTFKNRVSKNNKMRNLRNLLIQELENKYTFINYKDILNYNKNLESKEKIGLVILGKENNNMINNLPNTILLSVIKNDGKICNVKLKEELDKKGVVVSIGSVCNTNNKNASHVLSAINAPDIVKRGVLRISLGDTTTKKNIKDFVNIFEKSINKQLTLI